MGGFIARRPLRTTGLTLLEIVIALSLFAGIFAGAVALLNASNELARSVNDERAAAMRVDRALASISAEFRRGSLATVQHLDGSTFDDGDTGAGFQIRAVEGWSGGPQLGDVLRYEYSVPANTTEGQLVRRDGPVETLLARAITSFEVERDGNTFVFTVTAESGPTDDRRRRATGSIELMARNP